jgi:hypothetical protein
MDSSAQSGVARVCPVCERAYSPDANFCAADGAALGPSTNDARIGARVLNRYEIQHRLGKGGMGEVYLALDTRLQRQVAIKYVRVTSGTAADASARMEREARNAAILDHPNVIKVFDLNRVGEALVLVMEYAPGPTLQESIRDGMPYNVQNTSTIISQLAEGLTAIHRKGLVHRDLKPSNIVLTNDAQNRVLAKILDFGIARGFDDPSQSITATGIAIGTAAFMPPEQVAGLALDARSDVFALAAVACTMLAGSLRLPRLGSATSLANVPGSDLWPEPLRTCMNGALMHDRNARTASPRDFAHALEALSQTMPAWTSEYARPSADDDALDEANATAEVPITQLLEVDGVDTTRVLAMSPAAPAPQGVIIQAFIECVAGALKGQRFMLDEASILLGREPSECTVVFPPDTTEVSRLHASMWWDGLRQRVVLRDEGSTNGTFVGGVGRLDEGIEYHFPVGTTLWLGRPSCAFVVSA